MMAGNPDYFYEEQTVAPEGVLEVGTNGIYMQLENDFMMLIAVIVVASAVVLGIKYWKSN